MLSERHDRLGGYFYMKRILALLLLCCFCLTGCEETVEAVQEEIWTNTAYQSNETYDVIVMGTEPEGIAAAVSAARNRHENAAAW